jgi:hypothetical protein
VGVVVVSAASYNEVVVLGSRTSADADSVTGALTTAFRWVGVVVVSVASDNEVELVCAGAAATCDLDFEISPSTDDVADCNPVRLSDADRVLDTEAVGRMAMVRVELKGAE